MPNNISIKTLSRFYTHPKITRPSDLHSKFLYNYFVPDESTVEDSNDLTGGSISNNIKSYLQKDIDGKDYITDSPSGNKLVLENGRLVPEDMLTRTLPRFNEIEWQVNTFYPSIEAGTFPPIEKLFKEDKIIKEESVSSVYDATIRAVDTQIQERLTKKFSLMKKITPGHVNMSGIQQTRLSKMSGYDRKSEVPGNFQKLRNLHDLFGQTGVKRVNDLGKNIPSQQFEKARQLMPDFQYDRRLIKYASYRSNERMFTSDRKIKKFYEEDKVYAEQLPVEQTNLPVSDLTVNDYELGIKDVTTETAYLSAESIDKRAMHFKTDIGHQKQQCIGLIGFIVERYTRNHLEGKPNAIYFLDSGFNRNLIDPNVLYGETYFYSVRAVYAREDIGKVKSIDGKDLGEQLFRQYYASLPSLLTNVETIETTPPNEPDGIFFKFSYNKKKGLMINWQYPVGRSRDTKYFQVFRRSSINEPFQCIAEIDFNNAFVKELRREKVDDSRVIKKEGPTTYYEDTEFTRSSSFIYAIASVDAHGLTSGYSFQTRVGFNKSTNKITLKSVSRSGAPKQYPNFYVDPDEDETISVYDLTQEAIQSSGKKTIRLYLDPDCESYKLESGETRQLVSLANSDEASRGDSPVYKIHFINLDRQKDDSLEVRVRDLRK